MTLTETRPSRRAPQWISQTREEQIDAFTRQVEGVVPNGRITIHEDLDPRFFHDVRVLRALIMAKKEKGASIEFLTGPIVPTEPVVQTSLTFQGRGSRNAVRDLDAWLSPIAETGLVATRIRGRARTILDIRGPETTVTSFIALPAVRAVPPADAPPQNP